MTEPLPHVAYFEGLALAKSQVAELVDEHEFDLRIIEPSRPVVASDLNASLYKTLGSLALYGWWSASETTRVVQPQEPYKSGDRAGEERPDREMVNVFTYAGHPDRRIASIWYVDGKLNSATIGPVNGIQKVVTVLGDLLTYITGEKEEE